MVSETDTMPADEELVALASVADEWMRRRIESRIRAV